MYSKNAVLLLISWLGTFCSIQIEIMSRPAVVLLVLSDLGHLVSKGLLAWLTDSEPYSLKSRELETNGSMLSRPETYGSRLMLKVDFHGPAFDSYWNPCLLVVASSSSNW
jgi:hypothetical protein